MLEILMVVAISMVVAAIAVPMSGNALGFFRLSGDARALSNAVAVTKMRAASDFTQARLYVDLSTRRHHLETFRKTGAPGWVWQGGTTSLSQNTSIDFGGLATPPPNTQAVIGLAPPCRNDAGVAIGNTACVVFNSRGIPVDTTGAPTVADAVYLTDGTAVYAVTVSATGMAQLWRSGPTTASWAKQ